MEIELIRWIRQQQEALDQLIADAAKNFREDNQHANFAFDCRLISSEMFNLGKGKDLCYDRPSIGFIYSLWYHGKRINTFLRYYLNLILQSLGEEKIEIFDLGAGTGAVQWAVGIVYAALKENKIPVPAISVINIDSSPFMLDYNEHYLWEHFTRHFPVCANIKTVYRINSWVNEEATAGSNIWLSASYLFDHSENAKEVAAEFTNLVDSLEPAKLLLLSAMGKSALVDEVAKNITESGYQVHNTENDFPNQVFNGPLRQVSIYRRALQEKEDHGFTGEPNWSREGLYGKILVKTQGIFFPKDRKKIDLYVAHEKNRSRIQLTREQHKAAENTGNPTIIVGPAGCGKSVVLTQRVKNIIEARGNEYDPNLRLLVTTFNKDLVRQLGDWIEHILDCPNRCSRQQWTRNGRTEQYSWFVFRGSAHPNIYVFHLDILPTKIGGLTSCDVTRNGQDIETFHLELIDQIAKEYADKHNLDRKRMGKILDSVFLLEEYHRIIYGWQCSKETIYQGRERVGRGNNPTLRYNSQRRRVVWEIIYTYLTQLKVANLGNFTMQRHRLLRKLSRENHVEKFDYILVDEIQDCTFADYTIFQLLLKNPDNLVLAGDLAQSIHLGASVHFPSSGFEKIKLKGSFRLPFRISEAIKPLSQAINTEFRKRKASGETEIINPYKGSPPGARPIIVFGKTISELALKIRDIFSLYKIFEFQELAIFENDQHLAQELSCHHIKCSVEIILKSKGLEKPCVLWSTRVGIDTKNDVFEFVYTILTRTTSILIIAVCESVNSKFGQALRYLTRDTDKIILWDEETIAEITTLNQGQFPTVDEEDSDDSAEIPSNEEPNTSISIEEF